jgi:hypothetical protein
MRAAVLICLAHHRAGSADHLESRLGVHSGEVGESLRQARGGKVLDQSDYAVPGKGSARW